MSQGHKEQTVFQREKVSGYNRGESTEKQKTYKTKVENSLKLQTLHPGGRRGGRGKLQP
jgi:hypothetical protein